MGLQFTDSAEISGVRTTKDGYLVADVRIARTGIQEYAGSEIGWPEKSVVRVYRPEESVFDKASMASFAWRPVTVDHPDSLVTADNWRDLSVGTTGDSVARDGDFLRVPLTLMDGAAIEAVKAGKRELSCGYLADIERKSGVTDAGESYDAVQSAITGNHLAIVARGRAGAACRIGDSWANIPTTKEPDMPDSLRTVQVDGISIQTTDQGAQMIERLQSQVRDAQAAVAAKEAALQGATSQHVSAMQAKDGQLAALQATHVADLATKNGEIDALRAKIPDAATMDAMIADRSRIIDAASKLLGAGFDPKGKSVTDIRRAAVQKRLGDAMVADKPDEYVTAAFDTLIAAGLPVGKDPLRDAIRSSAPVPMNDSKTAYADMLSGMQNAWQRGGRKETV